MLTLCRDYFYNYPTQKCLRYHELILLIQNIKLKIKTNLLEYYVKFVDNTTKQSTYYKSIIYLFVVITSLFLF